VGGGFGSSVIGMGGIGYGHPLGINLNSKGEFRKHNCLFVYGGGGS